MTSVLVHVVEPLISFFYKYLHNVDTGADLSHTPGCMEAALGGKNNMIKKYLHGGKIKDISYDMKNFFSFLSPSPKNHL